MVRDFTPAAQAAGVRTIVITGTRKSQILRQNNALVREGEATMPKKQINQQCSIAPSRYGP